MSMHLAREEEDSQPELKKSYEPSPCPCPTPAIAHRLTRKHYFLLLSFLLVVTFFLVNPYLEDKTGIIKSPPAGGDVKVEIAETSPAGGDVKVETAETSPEKGDEGTAEPPKEPSFQYCTTWPVDSHGNFVTKAPPKAEHRLKLDSVAPKGGWKKPSGIKIIALIFYGRARTVDVLDCYLRENLASNGGYLDEVWFMVHTDKQDDLKWLKSFVNEEEAYIWKDLGDCATNGYGCIWDYAVDNDTIYIKIDDDMVSIFLLIFCSP